MVVGERIAIRCDGNERIGVGHVARCIPLATALARLGWIVSFVGAYEGLADWLLTRAQIASCAVDPGALCGIPTARFDAAILDSYELATSSICELARTLPTVTIAEANRCPTCGVLLDYHLDTIDPPDAHLLAGPSFAPLDPAIAGAGRAGEEIRTILVTVGGSLAARALLTPIALVVSSAFPDVDIVLAGAQSETNDTDLPRVINLPSPSALVDIVADIDLAVTAAGLTAYELACAGIPQVTIAIAPNQRRVAKGLNNSGLVLSLDLTSGDSLAQLPALLEQLRDVGLRRRLAERGREMFDGHGAQRAAIALTELYCASGTGARHRQRRTDS